MNIFSFTENSSEVFYIKPDTTIASAKKEDCNHYSFYTPDGIRNIVVIPFIYIKIDRACKSIRKEFAHRHYTHCGYGIQLITNDIIEGSVVDNSTFLSKPTRIESADESSEITAKSKGYDGFETIDEAIQRASQYISLRCGDIISLELPPILELTVEENTKQEFEYNDFKISIFG